MRSCSAHRSHPGGTLKDLSGPPAFSPVHAGKAAPAPRPNPAYRATSGRRLAGPRGQCRPHASLSPTSPDSGLCSSWAHPAQGQAPGHPGPLPPAPRPHLGHPSPGAQKQPYSSCLGAGGPHEGLLERDRTSEAGAVTGAYRGGRTPGNPRGSCGVPTNSLCCIRPSRSSSACRGRHRARPAPPGPDPDAPTAPHRRPGPGACGSPPTHGPPPGSGVMHSAAGRTGSSGVLCGPEGLRGARGAPREPRTSWAAVEVYGALRVTGAPRALRHRGI